MTESERSEREQRYRGPLPGEVPLSRESRVGGATPGLTFDDVTGRVIRTEPEPEADQQEDSGPEVGPTSEPGPPHVPDRAPSRQQRRTDGRAMIPLLSRALSSQLAQLAADDERAPDGWWFTPDTDR
jgi:hypothetical protein